MPQAAPSGNLTDAQIAAFARQAGFPDSEITTAVAVAKAESGGNPRAHNGKPPDNSYGLWQINMIGNLGPNRRKAFGIPNNESLFDPLTNAKAAYRIWNEAGKKWTPWTTYTGGSFRQYLSQDNSDSAGESSTTEDKEGFWESINPVDQLQDKIGESVDRATEQARIAMIAFLVVLIALVCIALGIIILNRQNVVKVAGLVGPGGKVKMAANLLGSVKK